MKLKVIARFELEQEFELDPPSPDNCKHSEKYIYKIVDTIMKRLYDQYGADAVQSEPMCDVCLIDGDKEEWIADGCNDFNAPTCEFDEEWEEYKKRIQDYLKNK